MQPMTCMPRQWGHWAACGILRTLVTWRCSVCLLSVFGADHLTSCTDTQTQTLTALTAGIQSCASHDRMRRRGPELRSACLRTVTCHVAGTDLGGGGASLQSGVARHNDLGARLGEQAQQPTRLLWGSGHASVADARRAGGPSTAGTDGHQGVCSIQSWQADPARPVRGVCRSTMAAC